MQRKVDTITTKDNDLCYTITGFFILADGWQEVLSPVDCVIICICIQNNLFSLYSFNKRYKDLLLLILNMNNFDGIL